MVMFVDGMGWNRNKMIVKSSGDRRGGGAKKMEGKERWVEGREGKESWVEEPRRGRGRRVGWRGGREGELCEEERGKESWVEREREGELGGDEGKES
ncbi:hypothetical protein Pcinc_043905 [Petrolisthes cinctipes]|uniref:Uncharacterized protein n=1 Tax=Petrolisthes cinctipes TaxID=88211 RepID=A0AAE1EHF4_PETCI|nr:hypothetical protein Pcinc_043905 [Petrolisthes cinctipes]